LQRLWLPYEEHHAKTFFQRLDLMAYRSGGDEQFFGGACETQVPRRDLESP
jgi:hypothetical protein